MKRLVVSMMVVGLVVGSLAVQAGAKKPKKFERVETAEYMAPGFLYTEQRLSNVCAENSACFTFEVKPKEKYVSIDVTDKSGTSAPIDVVIGDGTSRTYCGTTGKPLALKGATEVSVLVGIEAPPTCEGAGTTGSVMVKFTNMLGSGRNHRHHH